MRRSPEDHAFIDCLHEIEEVYRADEAITDDQRRSLSSLINTYTEQDAESDFAQACAEWVNHGLSINGIREWLALGAGIVDLAQLKFFADINDKLANGERQTINTRGMSDEEILALVQPLQDLLD